MQSDGSMHEKRSVNEKDWKERGGSGGQGRGERDDGE